MVKRLDADAVSRKDSLREALHAFRTGKIDILVGTQMIAKGLHFPNVTLVGIVNADMSLHLPDFRAGERTFQLLTQVAGRAGRGEVAGEVLCADLHAVSSGHPICPAPRFSRVLGAGDRVPASRRIFRPFWHMVLITLRSVHRATRRSPPIRWPGASATLSRQGRLPADTVISNPAPAPIEKSHGQYRFHLMLRTRRITRLSKGLYESSKS